MKNIIVRISYQKPTHYGINIKRMLHNSHIVENANLKGNSSLYHGVFKQNKTVKTNTF